MKINYSKKRFWFKLLLAVLFDNKLSLEQDVVFGRLVG